MAATLLALRFVLELCLLIAAAVIGAASSDRTVVSIGLAAGLVAIVALLWGTLLAPRRRIDLPLPTRVVIELALFVAAGIGLAASGYRTAGLALVGTELLLLPALAALGHPPGAHPGPPSRP